MHVTDANMHVTVPTCVILTVSVETSFRRVNWPNQAILRRSICVQTRTIQMRVIKVAVCTLKAKTRASQVCSSGR